MFNDIRKVPLGLRIGNSVNTNVVAEMWEAEGKKTKMVPVTLNFRLRLNVLQNIGYQLDTWHFNFSNFILMNSFISACLIRTLHAFQRCMKFNRNKAIPLVLL